VLGDRLTCEADVQRGYRGGAERHGSLRLRRSMWVRGPR
jgi:hypothetical protein